MFNNDFLSISLVEIIGLLVTIIGIWLVVKQLNETRLASQMEGLLELTNLDLSNSDGLLALKELSSQEDWNTLSDEEAFARVHNSKTSKKAWMETMTFFELLGVLGKRKALDKGLANDQFGRVVSIWWNRFEKVARQHRSNGNWDGYAENWEWLANEFKDK